MSRSRIPHITFADDLAILAENKSDSQLMVWDVEDSSNRERYCVHPAKSLFYGISKQLKSANCFTKGAPNKLAADRQKAPNKIWL